MSWVKARLTAYPVLWPAAGVLGALLVGAGSVYLVTEAPRPLVLAVGALLAAAGWMALWRLPLGWLMVAFVFLVVMTAFVPLSVRIGGLNLRTSQVFLPLVLLRLAAVGAFRRAAPWPLAVAGAGGALWAAFLFWTLVNLHTLPSAVVSLGRVFLLGVNLLTALTVYLLIAHTGAWRRAAAVLAYSIGFFNLVLLLIAVVTVLGLGSVSFWLGRVIQPVLDEGGAVVLGQTFRFRGGVIAGNLAVVALLFVLARWLDRRPRADRWTLLALLAAVGMVLGFSRQSLVSLAGGLGVFGLYLLGRGQVLRLARFAVVLTILTALGGVIISQLPVTRPFYQAFVGRAALLLQARAYQTGTAGERITMWTAMLRDVAANPLAGAGQDAYLQYYPAAGGGGSHNFAVEVLHTAGLGGFIPYLFLHAAVGWAGWRALRRRALARDDRLLLAGCLAAYVAVGLASLTNLIFSNPVYWLILGLLAGAAAVVLRAPAPAEAG